MHSTAVMAVATRRRMIELHETGKMKAAQIAEVFGISEKTFFKWKRRFHLDGEAGLSNKSTAPHHTPRKTSPDLEALVIEARKREPKSPLYLAQLPELKGKVSAHGIHRILVRHGFNRLSTPSKIAAPRYEAQRPWELVHLDVKYLPAIEGQKGREYEFTAIDDRTREVFAAIYPSKTTKNAVDFLNKVSRWAVTPIRAVLTDNGKEFVSGLFRKACRILEIKHKRTRPYRPQTNGKVERFHRTVDIECYQRRRFTSSQDRKQALADFLVYYNERRMHGALKFRTPREICIALGGRRVS